MVEIHKKNLDTINISPPAKHLPCTPAKGSFDTPTPNSKMVSSGSAIEIEEIQ